jgi:prepilin-type N-terminal cleavage/methylation domain-containing protein/prepilin-type processing-associated H-X9-DG protein
MTLGLSGETMLDFLNEPSLLNDMSQDISLSVRVTKAFSLIELLVCISILSVLASLISPSLSRMNDRTNGIQCANNMRGIGGSTAFYLGDHDRYPRTKHNPDGSLSSYMSYDSVLAVGGYDGRSLSEGDAWTNRPGGLLRSDHPDMDASMYQCPMDTGAEWELRTDDTFTRSYSMNGHASVLMTKYGLQTTAQSDSNMEMGLVTFVRDITDWSATDVSILFPSETIMLLERPDSGIVGNQYYTNIDSISSQYINTANKSYDFVNTLYHNSGYNYVMADGSVQNLIPQETVNPSCFPYTDISSRSYGLWSRGVRKSLTISQE